MSIGNVINNKYMSDFEIRALEIHSIHAWDFLWIIKSMDFIERNNMNSLVLHRNDFIDLIIYPPKYFGANSRKPSETMYDQYNDIFRNLYKYTPTRRSGPIHRRAFLKRVLHEAAKRRIFVYIENKELFFPDIILELNPHLLKKGSICASDPFWWEFIKEKYHDFFLEFPQISGIITSPGTGESRLSINSNRCKCARCKRTSKQDWYENLLNAMYEPIKKASSKLIVRDFVFDPTAQAELAAVMTRMPEDVVLALKNTPHDFYPTFPENPRIGNVGNHEQWIEFDAMGQYFGWGIGIADLTEDYRKRLTNAKNKGAAGAIFRTDWESLDGQSSFYTPNLINQYAGAAIADNLKIDNEDIYRKFLEDENWFLLDTSEEEKKQAINWFMTIMSKTWSVTSRTPYVNECVFSDSSLAPLGLEHAYWLSEEKNSLRDWDKSKWEALSPVWDNVIQAIAEKESALEDITTLISKFGQKPDMIKQEKYSDLKERLLINKVYVRLFKTVVTAIVLTRYLLKTNEDRNGKSFQKAKVMITPALEDILNLRTEICKFYIDTSYTPHIIYTLMDPDRLTALYNNLVKNLKAGGLLQ